VIFADTSVPLPIDISTFISDPEVALLVILLILALVGAGRGWWVPGFIYKKSEDRADALQKANEASTQALKDLTTEVRQRGGIHGGS
jgi:hypothetical protein